MQKERSWKVVWRLARRERRFDKETVRDEGSGCGSKNWGEDGCFGINFVT
jgi:hypothetical protein